MNKLMPTVAIAAILILAAGVGYLIFQNQRLIKQLAPSPQTAQNQAPQISTQTPTPITEKKIARKDVEKQIEDSINTKNYQAIKTYMTLPRVNFSLMSTECCEPMTPDEALTQLDYIEDGLPLNFDQQNATIQNLETKNPQLTNTFIGLSTGGEHLAAFTLDGNNKISAIQLSVSYKLYNQ